MTWYSYTGEALEPGDTVLDNRGDVYRLPDTVDYGRENFAKCDGIGYTHRQQYAVSLGETFKVISAVRGARGRAISLKLAAETEEITLSDNKQGQKLYHQLFTTLVEPRLREEIRARRPRMRVDRETGEILG